MEETLRRCVVCIENTNRNRKIALLTLPGGGHDCITQNNNLILHIYSDQSINVNMIHHSGVPPTPPLSKYISGIQEVSLWFSML